MLLQTFYTNPLLPGDFPDPSVIWVKEKGFIAYGTHDAFSPTLNNILVTQSWDLVHWQKVSGALKEPPAWAQNSHCFWCPHVAVIDKEYRLYYAAEPDTKDGMCLAMATANDGLQFTDMGKPLAQVHGSTYQMIDPCFFTDPKSKKHYLYYGSAHEPIRAVELAPDGKTFLGAPIDVLQPQPGQPFENLREGAFVTYHQAFDRYYLWVSGDNTWAENGYAVTVYWSHNPVWGFEKVPGNHIVLQHNQHWDAPGQNCIVTDAIGQDWMIYHAVDPNERFIKGTDRVLRKMCIDKVHYTFDGWPYITGASPSFIQQKGPVVEVPDDIAAQLPWKKYEEIKK